MENVQACNYNIIVFTETWLNEGYYDAELGIPEFNIYRTDRSNNTSVYKRGGGTLIAVHKSVVSKRLNVPDDIEQTFVSVGSGDANLILGAVYFPPRSNTLSYVTLSNTLDRLSVDMPNSTICLFGDFNLPHSIWETGNLGSSVSPSPGAPLEEVRSIQELSNTCSFHNLLQVNQVLNANDTLLDLIMTQDSSTSVCLANHHLIPPDSYHPPLCAQVSASNSATNEGLCFEGFYRDFKSANFLEMTNFLDRFEWDSMLKNKSLDVMLGVFCEVLYLTVELFVPLKKYSARKFPVWYSLELKNCIINKKIAHKRYKSSRSMEDYREFSRLRALCGRLTRECYTGYVHTTEQSLFSNLKKFWSFVNSKRKCNEYPNEFTYENRKSCSGQEIVNMFADYFATVYSTDSYDASPCEVSTTNIFIPEYRIPISAIYTKLSSLDINKGPGPDGIPPILLKSCSFNLSRPLFHIFNLSLHSGIFPDFWKVSFITPIFKSGLRSEVANYRSITISSTVPKVFESLVCDFISPKLDPLLIDQQFGFRNERDTEFNLLTHADSLADALEGGYRVDTVYTDFSKAFDRVSHDILIHKLKMFGLDDPLLSWFRSYLSQRTQIVRIGNFYSREIDVPSGVPQGSHLGPLLFNVFINDVHECISHSQFLLFADDLKLYCPIHNIEDCDKLQYDVNNLVDWCQRNGMALNPVKCKAMSFYRGRNPINVNYHIMNVPLENVKTVKDLGITFDVSLNFISHLSNIVSKAFQLLGFIKRCTADFSSVAALKQLYCALVRPHLEYASCVWSPYYNIHKQTLERVQHKFLKLIAYRMNLIDYTDAELLSLLNMSPILVRHQRRDLLSLYNLLHNRRSAPMLLNKIGLHVPRRDTRSSQSFSVPFHRTNYGYNSFISRASRLANDLNQLDFFSLPNQFLKALKRDLM